MSPREHDPELRDLLSAGDSLHEQLARLDRSEPPEELDRIVIERARQAIRVPQSERPIRQVRWAVPLALAATLLISFALVLHQMGPQQPVATAPTAATAEPSAAEDSAIVTQARVNETPDGQVATTAPRESRAPTVAAASAPPPRAPESEQPAARARVPNPALANREAYEVSTVTVAGAREGTSAAPELAAQADAAQPSGMLARREKGEAKADFRSDPDAWMRYIARLRELGRSEEADREYAEFRRVFPAYKYVAPADPPPGDIAPDR